MYVDDIILYCIGDFIDVVIFEFNKVLEEFLYWCKINLFVFYLKKCEVMIFYCGRFIGFLKELMLV